MAGLASAWRWPDGGRRSTIARWTRRRAAPACTFIADLTWRVKSVICSGTDRDRVLNAARRLRGTIFSIRPQFPQEIETQTRQLLTIMKQARNDGFQAKMVRENLYINNRLYVHTRDSSQYRQIPTDASQTPHAASPNAWNHPRLCIQLHNRLPHRRPTYYSRP